MQVGSDPVALAIGANGVWVANAQSGTVSRIDPDTNRVVEQLEVHGSPAGISSGASGELWVVTAPL